MSIARNPVEVPFKPRQGSGILPRMVLEVLGAVQLSNLRGERRMRRDRRKSLLQVVNGFGRSSTRRSDNVACLMIVRPKKRRLPTFDCILLSSMPWSAGESPKLGRYLDLKVDLR